MIIGVACLAILRIASFMFLAQIGLGFCVAAFFMSYMAKIVMASAQGKPELPDWPKVVGGDIFWPLWPWTKAILISLGPGLILIVVSFVYGASEIINLGTNIAEPPMPGDLPLVTPTISMATKAMFFGGIGLLLIGSLYLPMAILAAALGAKALLNPIALIVSVIRVFRTYVVALFVLAVIYVIGFVVQHDIIHPWIRLMFGGFISFYLAIVEMRVLGLIYYTRGTCLGWDDVEL